MTEEDQILVATAALAGVRFWRTLHGYWAMNVSGKGRLIDRNTMVAKYTLGRAAALALRYMGQMTTDEWMSYENRTAHINTTVDVDISLLQAMAHAAEMPDAAMALTDDLPPR